MHAAMFLLASCSGSTPGDACSNMDDQCGGATSQNLADCEKDMQKLLDDGIIKQSDVDCFIDASSCSEVAECSTAMATAALNAALANTDTTN